MARVRSRLLSAVSLGFCLASCLPESPPKRVGQGGSAGTMGSPQVMGGAGGTAGSGGSGGSPLPTAGTGGPAAPDAGPRPGGSGGVAGGGRADSGAAGSVADARPGDASRADAAPVATVPKLSTDIAPFIAMTCARLKCHDPITKEHGMDVSTAAGVFASWVNKRTADHCRMDMPVTRVIPSNVAQSFVLTMVEGVGRCMAMPRMPPPPLAALTPDQIKMIKDWIAAGAPNN